ncbi:MAG: hypothetical protein F4X20_07525 [Dehalococcoidia bacterium]|nr:hypothetical protein [Dehalococcoidia bacterium]
MDIKRTLNPLLVILATVLVALALACGTAAEPTATPTPVPPTPTATPIPPTPEPTATPESMPDSMPMLAANATWQDLFDALLTDDETACVRDTVGEEIFTAMAARPFLEQVMQDIDMTPFTNCLSRESQVDLYVTTISGVSGGSLSDESLACLRAGLIDIDEELFADGDLPPTVAVLFLNCLSEDELASFQPPSGMETDEETPEIPPLDLLRAQAELDPNVQALFDCLDQNATQRELEAYFNENSQTLPPAAMECFTLHPLSAG